jgi:hypothetical protein
MCICICMFVKVCNLSYIYIYLYVFVYIFEFPPKNGGIALLLATDRAYEVKRVTPMSLIIRAKSAIFKSFSF